MSILFKRQIDLIDEKSDQIKLFIYTLIAWCSLFLLVDKKIRFKNLPRKISDDIKNRIISIIHGQVSFWFSFYIILNQYKNMGEKNTNEVNFVIISSASYFTYDLFACIYYNLFDFGLLIHHGSATMGYLINIVSKFGGFASIFGLFVAEVSNLPMHTRIILRNLNLRYTLIYEACEYTYFILYIIFRGLIFPIVFYSIIKESNIPIFLKLSACILFVQSAYYMLEMKKIFKRLRNQYVERKTQGIQYKWFSVPDNVIQLSYARKGQVKDKIF